MRNRTGDRRRGGPAGVARTRWAAPVLCALGAVAAGAFVYAWSALAHADDPAAGQPSSMPIQVLAAAMVALACGVVVTVGLGAADRVAGPEHRLVQSLRRMRSGDLSFRVSLRAGDLLGDLATECNAVLDWLNENPPQGARTGSDLLDVDLDAAMDRELAVEGAAAAEARP